MMTKPVYVALLLLVLGLVLVAGLDNSCPYQKCVCYDGTIDCYANELKKLPPLHVVNSTVPLSLRISGNSLTTIPAGGLPPRLSSIDFQENPIKTIDKDAFNASADTLTQLTFADALFTELPDAFLRLHNLSHLIIGDMNISTWDDTVVKHIGATLQTLLLSNIGLTSWPTWIRYLPHLGTLEISDASVVVPDDALDSQINTLFSLNLENGILTEIPKAVSKLTHMEYLVLDSNNISNAAGIPNSPVLATLSLDDNKISDAVQLSEHLLSISGSLTDLQLSKNHLTYLPDLSAMTKLEYAYFTGNAITYTGTSQIPSSLKQLYIEENNLQSLDSFMRSGLNLIELKLTYNSVKEILGVDIPVSVQDMDISFNLLTELTDESFPSNSNMLNLNLDSNSIVKVSPKAFANLSKLTSLTMAFNKITRLPLSLTYLTSAFSIDLGRNDDMICTCLEKDLRSWVQVNKVSISGSCGITTIDNFISVLSVQCPD